ncbi:hypothetical protein AMTRI_Chr12g267080 [Amborella trichopoda]
MALPPSNTYLFVGLNKGHIVTKKEISLTREVVGFARYEKRITELLKVGKDKHALKVARERDQLEREVGRPQCRERDKEIERERKERERKKKR